LKHEERKLNKFYKIDSNELKTLDPFKECLSKEQYAIVKANLSLS